MKYPLSVGMIVVLSSIGYAQAAIAQVAADGTVGTIVSPGQVFNITGGTRPSNGPNLFHSFSQFSLPTGSSAIFQNDPTVQTIFSRVTGGSRSDINGTIQTQGNASLFLMNPNGIVFGPNAKLELGGSFIGTTANSIKFEDGIEFSAANLTNNPLLSVKVPIGLQMGTNPGAIAVQGMGHRLVAANALSPYQPYAAYQGLQVRPNQTLALIGGAIGLQGGILQATHGHIELGSLAQSGLVTLQSISQGFSIGYPGITNFADIDLRDRSIIEVAGVNPSSIQVQGRRVTLQDGSLISGLSYGAQTGGPINVFATEQLTLSGALPSLNILSSIKQDSFGAAQGGTIRIQTPNLVVQTGALLFSRAYGKGSGGDVVIEATHMNVDGFAPTAPDVFSRVGTLTASEGKGGNLMLSGQTLRILEGGFVGSVTTFNGKSGGDVLVNVDRIQVQGFSPAQFSSTLGAVNVSQVGNSGNLTIHTNTLKIRESALVTTSSVSAGNAGNLSVIAKDSVEVNGYAPGAFYESSLSSNVTIPAPIYRYLFGIPEIPSGSSGNVFIRTPLLVVSNGANLNVSNYGIGEGGWMEIQAEKIVVEDFGSIGANTLSGKGGNLTIQSNFLKLNNQSRINVEAFGSDNLGDGGNVTINASIIVGLKNSDIIANSFGGRGGNIQITTQGIFGLKFRPQLTPENDITASSQFGVNGNVQINTIGINPTNSLNALPVDIIDPSDQIADRCASAKTGSFVSTGRGGIPRSPMQTRKSDRTWHDLRLFTTANSSVIQPIAATQPIALLVEASAFQVDESGAIALVAEKPIASQSGATCGMGAGE